MFKSALTLPRMEDSYCRYALDPDNSSYVGTLRGSESTVLTAMLCLKLYRGLCVRAGATLFNGGPRLCQPVERTTYSSRTIAR